MAFPLYWPILNGFAELFIPSLTNLTPLFPSSLPAQFRFVCFFCSYSSPVNHCKGPDGKSLWLLSLFLPRCITQLCSTVSKLHHLVTFNNIFSLYSSPHRASSHELALFSFGEKDYIQVLKDGCRRGLDLFIVSLFPLGPETR